nr:hypothetical protein [uncultured Rhodoferax sp.]
MEFEHKVQARTGGFGQAITVRMALSGQPTNPCKHGDDASQVDVSFATRTIDVGGIPICFGLFPSQPI